MTPIDRETSERIDALSSQIAVLTRVVSKIISRVKDEKSFWETDAVVSGIEKRLNAIENRLSSYELKLFLKKWEAEYAAPPKAKKAAQKTAKARR